MTSLEQRARAELARQSRLVLQAARLEPRKHISPDNLGRTTKASGILGRVKRIEYGFFPAEIPAIEFAVKKYHPMPAATGLPHFKFQAKHCSNRFYVSWRPISRFGYA